MEDTQYRRRSRVLWRPGQLGVPREPRYGWFWFGNWVNDGGDDAPLIGHGRAVFRATLCGIAIVGVALIVITRLGF